MTRRLSYGLSAIVAVAIFGCSKSDTTQRSTASATQTAERFEPKGSAIADQRVERAKKLFIERGVDGKSHAFLPDSDVDTFRVTHMEQGGDAVEATPAAHRFQPLALRVQLPLLASGTLGVRAGAMHL